jgi:hypothetical protein
MFIPINKNTKITAAKLAYITYLDEDGGKNQKPDMISNLNAIPATCNGPYKLVWGPAINHGILSLIAQGADGSYAIAFRGTLTSFGDAVGVIENILDDITGLHQVPWQFPLTSGASVTWGTNNALTFAIAATDQSLGLSMIDFLRKNLRPTNKPVMVAGHSLGGAMASAASVWLMDQIPKDGGPAPIMVPFTFAAPTISDQKFADLYAKMCPTAYHCVNKHDIVPMAWTNFDTIEGSFNPKPTLKGFSPILWGAVQLAGMLMKNLKNGYVNLPGTRDIFEPGPPAAEDNFVTIAGNNHSIQRTYLKYVDPENILLM